MFDFQDTPDEQNQFGNTALSLEQTGKSEEEQLEAHVAALRHQIEEANYQYYVQDNPPLTDAEYDGLLLLEACARRQAIGRAKATRRFQLRLCRITIRDDGADHSILRPGG